MAPGHVAVRGGRLEVLDRGTGAPVLFVRTHAPDRRRPSRPGDRTQPIVKRGRGSSWPSTRQKSDRIPWVSPHTVKRSYRIPANGPRLP